MRTNIVVLPEPFSDNGFGLVDAHEPFCVENFSSQSSVETLVIPVLPRTAGIDTDRFDANLGEPRLEGFSDKLRTVI